MIGSYAKRRLRLLWVVTMHLILPVWFILLMATAGQEDSSTWLMLLIAVAAYIAYISIAGRWSWFGIYAQRALPLVVVAAAFITRPRFRVINMSPQAAELRLLSVALAAWFLLLAAMALIGRRARAEVLDLLFPFKEGTFMVEQGGSTRRVNRHAGNRPQRYAVDLVKLGEWGVRARGIYPVALAKYAIYGVEVVSPLEGVVVSAVDNLPDQMPPARDLQNPAGNHVAIASQGVTVYLSHLMKGSVTVDVGQRVRAGKVLGRAGNSGDTPEPRLHIHAEKEATGLAMRFGGRFLVRNDCVDTKESH